MIGEKIFDDKEVILSNARLIEIIINEIPDYKKRRLSKAVFRDVLNTFWTIIATELASGNTVMTPIGSFTPKVVRKYGKTNWYGGRIKKRFIPVEGKRVKVFFKQSGILEQTVIHLLKEYDARQAKRGRDLANKRRMERASRSRKSVTDEAVGLKPFVMPDLDLW